jgi:hypothetical protein
MLLSLSSIVQAAQFGDSRQRRTVQAFHGISVSSGINLYLTQDNTQQVTVEADEDDLDDLVTKVEGGILKIYMKDRSWLDFDWKHNDRKVYVTFKTLDWLQASAGSDVTSQSVLNLEDLEVDASSGSDVKLELNASRVKAQSSSGSDIHLKGKANSLEARASSGSDINAGELQTKKCNANASSGSDIRVHVSEQLDANASSGGDISYSGNPAHKDINESSGGDVRGR